jgi:multimeric flavodoxin WrbA
LYPKQKGSSMKITCISAANIEVARQNSASVHTCELIRGLLQAAHPDAMIEIVPLIDYELNACRMCGRCLHTQRCARDDAFNQVFEKMIAADGLFFVIPHYAPLPSKLMMLTEKMEEMAFLGWSADPEYRSPLHHKPAGVIGHGGQVPSADVIAYYQRMLVEPVAAALSSVGIKVIKPGDGKDEGVAFGIRSISQRPGSVFVDITHDWDDIRQRVAPLVLKVAAASGMPQ